MHVQCIRLYKLTYVYVVNCHSNETRAPIANPPYSAQVTSGSLQWFGNTARDRQTHGHTDGRGHYTFRLRYAHAKCNNERLDSGDGALLGTADK